MTRYCKKVHFKVTQKKEKWNLNKIIIQREKLCKSLHSCGILKVRKAIKSVYESRAAELSDHWIQEKKKRTERMTLNAPRCHVTTWIMVPPDNEPGRRREVSLILLLTSYISLLWLSGWNWFESVCVPVSNSSYL